MSEPTRPVLRWYGGKWRLAPWVIKHFPPHLVYVEPFGGAASILLRKPMVAAEVYNDLDGRLVNLFRVLRDPEKASDLRRRVELTFFSRAEFNWSYGEPVDDIDDAHRMIVLSFMGQGSDSVTRHCPTGFRAKMSDGKAMPSQAWASWPQSIPQFTKRLRNVTVEQCDATILIDRMDSIGTLFYVDPPYLPETRKNGIRKHGYRHELTENDHVALLDRLNGARGMVVLSGYPSTLYDMALQGWHRVETSALADRAQIRTEVLWLNEACVAGLDGHRDQRELFKRVAE
ncbi:MAG: adenine methylase [Proteobacteria bacterium]|nr:adenine methylase [Pseudomonadota bacterium]